MIDFYKVPVYELNRIKNGADYITPEGEVIANARLTRPSDPPRRYAYCSDTIFRREIAEQISGVDLLFMRLHLPNRNWHVLKKRTILQQPKPAG